MIQSAGLKQLPPEVLGMICSFLPVHDVANLEIACSTLYEKLNRASVWRKKAYALLDIDEGNFVLAMLNFLRIHQISKPSAFKVVLGVQKLIESTLIDLNSTLAHWRCLQPEYQALNGVITCKRPGPYGAITDIIKGLFTDMKHYVQGLELFQEAKLNQILSWNRNLFRYDFYDMDLDHEHIKRRETYFYRIFLFTHGPIDVSSALYKFELLNSRREPFFSDSPLAMADIIANTLKANDYPLALPSGFTSFLSSWPLQVPPEIKRKDSIGEIDSDSDID